MTVCIALFHQPFVYLHLGIRPSKKKRPLEFNSSDLHQSRGSPYGTLFATFSCHHPRKCSVSCNGCVHLRSGRSVPLSRSCRVSRSCRILLQYQFGTLPCYSDFNDEFLTRSSTLLNSSTVTLPEPSVSP